MSDTHRQDSWSTITDEQIEKEILSIIEFWGSAHTRSLGYNILVHYGIDYDKPHNHDNCTAAERADNMAWVNRFQNERVIPIVNTMISKKLITECGRNLSNPLLERQS